MSKHTKGPWEYEGTDEIDKDHMVCVKDGFNLIANCGPSHLTKGGYNAQRIVDCVNALEGFADPSAAADLLEAAKELVFQLGRLIGLAEGENLSISTYFPPELQDVFHSTKQAIAKAEGGGE